MKRTLTANPEGARLRTDSLFYRLFQDWTGLVLELASLEPMAGYTLRAEEIKQTGFRRDGVQVPAENAADRPLVFVETQFQHDPDFHARGFAELFLYLYRQPPRRPGGRWRCFPTGRRKGWRSRPTRACWPIGSRGSTCGCYRPPIRAGTSGGAGPGAGGTGGGGDRGPGAAGGAGGRRCADGRKVGRMSGNLVGIQTAATVVGGDPNHVGHFQRRSQTDPLLSGSLRRGRGGRPGCGSRVACWNESKTTGCWRRRPACRKRRLRGCAGKGADGAIGARKRGFQQHERPNPAVKVGAIGGNPALRHTRFPVPAVQRIG